jgi:hypothetical protein
MVLFARMPPNQRMKGADFVSSDSDPFGVAVYGKMRQDGGKSAHQPLVVNGRGNHGINHGIDLAKNVFYKNGVDEFAPALVCPHAPSD